MLEIRYYVGADGHIPFAAWFAELDSMPRAKVAAAVARMEQGNLSKVRMMATTRSFKELVQQHVSTDPAFAEALLREGIETMLSGDVESGKIILRDYIKATVGFEKLGEATGTQPKSLIRMFGPRGNPQAKNLFNVIGYLQKHAGLQLHVTTES
jgi:DNA-binding phage protein